MWSNIENGVGESYDTTYRGVEAALKWQPGSCRSVLEGSEAYEIPTEDRPMTRAEKARVLIDYVTNHPDWQRDETLVRILVEKAQQDIAAEESAKPDNEAAG